MIDFEVNFKSNNDDLQCRVRGVVDETCDNFFNCNRYLKEVQEFKMNEVDKSWIFGEDVENIKRAAECSKGY